VGKAQRRESLDPKKPPGKRRKLDEAERQLLERDLEERPAATLPQRREFLERVAGVKVSNSTVSRMLGRMGFSRKKISGSGRARRVLEGCLVRSGG
jgi:transposase